MLPNAAPDGSQFGTPLGLASALNVAANSQGLMTVRAKEDQWVTSIAWAIVDPAAAPVVAAVLTSIQAGGELLYDGQNPQGVGLLFPAVTINQPAQIVGFQRPFLLSASQTLQFSLDNQSGVQVRLSAVIESYRRTLEPKVDPIAGALDRLSGGVSRALRLALGQR